MNVFVVFIDYKTELEAQFDAREMEWLKSLLFKEAFGRSKIISRNIFMEFRGLGPNNPSPTMRKSFYARVVDYATGNLAMKEVFNMNSIVRMDAIRNLGQRICLDFEIFLKKELIYTRRFLTKFNFHFFKSLQYLKHFEVEVFVLF